MSEEIHLDRIRLAGFRAYLKEQEFSFYEKRPKSLAIFAPNAKGKSSLVDALEFFFSQEGTLERLGERTSGSKPGRQPLEHVKAETEKVAARVAIYFREGQEVFGEPRVVGIQNVAPLTPSALRVLERQKHEFIIRGYQLRSFVEGKTPEERYAEVSRWFGLESLVVIQRNLRALRSRVKESVERDQAFKIRLQDLSKATGYAVQIWDEDRVCDWFNRTQLQPLEKSLSISSLRDDNDEHRAIEARKTAEDEALGLTVLRQIVVALQAIVMETDDGKQMLPRFERCVSELQSAANSEAVEKAKAADAVFKDLWEKAKAVLNDGSVQTSACPVCETPFDQGPKGSREAVCIHISAQLGKLAAYAAAQAKVTQAKASLQTSLDIFKTGMNVARTVLEPANEPAAIAMIIAYEAALRDWVPGMALPQSAELRTTLLRLTATMQARKVAIEKSRGEKTFAKALAKLDELIDLKAKIDLAAKTKAEMQKLQASLDGSASVIGQEIAAQVKAMLGQLMGELNSCYASIQAGTDQVRRVELRLPDVDERAQQRMELVFDYAENRKGVNPAGYLSDSQIHTLALSLRLAAIKMFNIGLPWIVLDDVVTSYDADHRKNIVKTLVERFEGFQVLLVTHDEMFFRFLRDQLPTQSWTFRRITELDANFGPRFSDHRVADEEIDDLLARGERAGNEIRQAEEEWLLDVGRAFGVDIRIREPEKAFSYGRYEMATALAKFLKEKKLTPPLVPGNANAFIASIQSGVIENFESHFSDAPYASGSSGDDKARWNEFKEFRALFKCPNQSCAKAQFHRPDGSALPLCRKCGRSFSF